MRDLLNLLGKFIGWVWKLRRWVIGFVVPAVGVILGFYRDLGFELIGAIVDVMGGVPSGGWDTVAPFVAWVAQLVPIEVIVEGLGLFFGILSVLFSALVAKFVVSLAFRAVGLIVR